MHECENQKKLKKKRKLDSNVQPPTPDNPHIFREIAQQPVLEIQNSDNFPYPMFWIRPDRLHPEPVILIKNYPYDENNLIVMAVPIDSATCQPVLNAHLLENTECVNPEITKTLPAYTHAVRFKGLKLSTTAAVAGLSHSRGNRMRLSFVLFSKHVNPPQYLTHVIGDEIRIFNRRNELPRK